MFNIGHTHTFPQQSLLFPPNITSHTTHYHSSSCTQWGSIIQLAVPMQQQAFQQQVLHTHPQHTSWPSLHHTPSHLHPTCSQASCSASCFHHMLKHTFQSKHHQAALGMFPNVHYIMQQVMFRVGCPKHHFTSHTIIRQTHGAWFIATCPTCIYGPDIMCLPFMPAAYFSIPKHIRQAFGHWLSPNRLPGMIAVFEAWFLRLPPWHSRYYNRPGISQGQPLGAWSSTWFTLTFNHWPVLGN